MEPARHKTASRCLWAENGSPLYTAYHDEEWGVPQHDDAILFEFLILEGAQAGLSWSTILNKRENYRNAFSGFDVRTVAKYDKTKIGKLMLDAGIVRNRLKIEATVANARAFIEALPESRYGHLKDLVSELIVWIDPYDETDLEDLIETADANKLALWPDPVPDEFLKQVGSSLRLDNPFVRAVAGR